MGTVGVWVLLAVVIVAFLVVFWFAVRAFSRNARRKKGFYEKADRQRANMLKYRDADRAVLAAAPPMELIEGLAAAVQEEMADNAAPNAAFLQLPLWRQYAYAGYYLLSDASVKLSAFFRNSGEPLLSAAVACARATGAAEYIRLLDLEYEMLDEDNDSVSVDDAQLDAWDAAFAALSMPAFAEAVRKVILDAMEQG